MGWCCGGDGVVMGWFCGGDGVAVVMVLLW